MTAPPLDVDPRGLEAARVLAPTLFRALPVDRHLDGHLASSTLTLHWAIFQQEERVTVTRPMPEWCRLAWRAAGRELPDDPAR